MALQSYCEGNESLAQAWAQQGLYPCFYFTLVPAVLFSVCLLLGALQYACYARFSRTMEPKYIPRSPLYAIQVLLSLLLALLPFVSLLWQALGTRQLYGYMVLYACLSAVSWTGSIGLLQLERTRVMTQDRIRGHGAILLLYWALAFAAENLAFISWNSPLWWWGLEDTSQKVGGGGYWREGWGKHSLFGSVVQEYWSTSLAKIGSLSLGDTIALQVEACGASSAVLNAYDNYSPC